MKNKIVTVLIMCMCVVCMVGCGKKKVSEPTEVVDSIAEESSESGYSTIIYPTKEYNYIKPTSTPQQGIEPSSDIVETEETVPQETKEPTSEVIESTDNDLVNTGLIPEDEMVHVTIPDENLDSMKFLYDKAEFKVDGDVDIDNNIDFGIRVDSTKVKELITLIYQGTGCTSHVISDEYIAIFDYDPYDYSARMTLSDGTVYCLYLVDDMCFALKEV